MTRESHHPLSYVSDAHVQLTARRMGHIIKRSHGATAIPELVIHVNSSNSGFTVLGHGLQMPARGGVIEDLEFRASRRSVPGLDGFPSFSHIHLPHCLVSGTFLSALEQGVEIPFTFETGRGQLAVPAVTIATRAVVRKLQRGEFAKHPA